MHQRPLLISHFRRIGPGSTWQKRPPHGQVAPEHQKIWPPPSFFRRKQGRPSPTKLLPPPPRGAPRSSPTSRPRLRDAAAGPCVPPSVGSNLCRRRHPVCDDLRILPCSDSDPCCRHQPPLKRQVPINLG